MKFENTKVWGFEHALRGMRNAKNSWDKADSEPLFHLTQNFSEEDENADLTIKTKRTGIFAIAARNEDGMSKLIESVEGDQELYKAFCDSMASLKLYFNIVEP